MDMRSAGDTFLKKYFRVIAKPITLTLLFFILLISMYCLFYPYLFGAIATYEMPAEEKVKEFARISSLESWLINVFQGNFGWSMQYNGPISDWIYWRTGQTLLLIGISIAASVLTGMGLVLIFSFWKGRKLKPLTFAHSLNGYFFGLVALVGIVIYFLFHFLEVRYGIRLEIPNPLYPYNLPRRWAPDMLRPIIILVIVNFVRNILVIGGSGSLFESQKRYKSLLLPITTIDFNLAISAAIVIEILSGTEGLGKWLVRSLEPSIADYNVSIAAIIFFLAIAVGLGLASTPLDILKHMSGLREKLERKPVAEPKTNTHSSRNVWKFLRRKTFWIGLAVVFSFLLLAALAPWITGGIDPNAYGLAEKYAMPEWIALYNLAYQNLPRTTDYLLAWNWTLPLPEGVTVQETDEQWIIRYEGNESVLIPLYTKFHYPYNPPKTFYYQFKWGAKPEVIKVFPFQSVATARYSLELNLTIPDGTVYPVWDQHWWRYKEGGCALRNPYYDPQLDPDYNIGYSFKHSERYYPGGEDYRDYWWNYTEPWERADFKDYQPAYDLYRNWTSLLRLEEQTGSHIPIWDTIESDQSVHITVDRFQAVRLGYREFRTEEMTHDLFSPSGEFTFRMYIVIQPTRPNGKCQVNITNLEVYAPGLLWGLLGTDNYGRDCWSRLVYGARGTLAVASLTATLAVFAGFPLGFIAGYFQDWPDNIVMTIVDAILVIPVLPFLLLITTYVGHRWLRISLVTLPFLFVLTTKAFRHKYLTHPLNRKLTEISEENPALNFLKGVSGNFCLAMVSVILLFTTIDFLGFGDPGLLSWGRELYMMQTVGYVQQAWWWWMPPIVFTALLALGFLLLGVSLDEERY